MDLHTIIDPKYLRSNKSSPTLYFTNIQVDAPNKKIDTANLEMDRLKITSDWLNTTLSFVALNYANPKRCTYKYMIPEIQNKWISLGFQNFVSIIGLAPGTYHLKIQGFNEDDVSSNIRELVLVYSPKWYQTWWLKTIVGLILVGLGYVLYRIRINQFEREKKIRTKLASDLHDDLGSTMNSIKIYSNLALTDGFKVKYLLKIKEAAQEAITGIRDIIWVLDDKKDSIEELFFRISTFAAPLCDVNGIKFQIEMSDNCRDRKLRPEERRNLYMMLKETVNNAIKYSNSHSILLKSVLKDNEPQIIVEDDGQGFDIAEANEGNGLKNMKRRANEIKFILDIRSVQGVGTAIIISKSQ